MVAPTPHNSTSRTDQPLVMDSAGSAATHPSERHNHAPSHQDETARKVKDFARAEIINRFIKSRPDFPSNDPVKMERLWEAANEGLEGSFPPLASMKDACALYDAVDSVADDMAATYFPDQPASPSASRVSDVSSAARCGGAWEPLPIEAAKALRFNETWLVRIKEDAPSGGVEMSESDVEC